MRNTKSAFTLVELIVVITILAILGTIAFISLQGYSAEARNSKRTSDLGNMRKAIELKLSEGTPLMSFVVGTGSDVAAATALAGVADYSNYAAGTPNYTVLGAIEKDFKDPNKKEYRIGATTAQNGVFQLAATMELDGTNTARITGTYVPRTAVTASASGSFDADNYLIILDDEFANTFKSGDTLDVGGKIKSITRDGLTLTVTDTPSGNSFALADDEELGLINGIVSETGTDTSATNNALEDNDTTHLPY